MNLDVSPLQFILLALLMVILTASYIDYTKGYAISNYPQCFYPEPLEECIARYEP